MTASYSLIVPSDIEFAGARALAARLAAEIDADPGLQVELDLSAPTMSVHALQIAAACRKTLCAAGRLAALGPIALAVLEPAGSAGSGDDQRGECA